MSPPRFLVVTYPAQGHINPSLQFSKRLAAAVDAEVTFVTTLYANRRMSAGDTSAGGGRISHAPFSDGYDEGFKPSGGDIEQYLSSISRRGSQAISDLIAGAAAEGRPYTCLVYTLLLPWAGRAAGELGLPAFLLWIQPATVFDIYYYYFHGHEAALSGGGGGSETMLPGLSLRLAASDLPSFMDAANTYSSAIALFKAQFELLDESPNPRVLVNTFAELEPEALSALGDGATFVPVGPLIPSAFLGGDLFQRSKHGLVVEWLSSKPAGSVVYVSFGSISILSRAQMDEIGKGLLGFGRPFLWVVRDDAVEEIGELSSREALEKLGLVVPWVGQVEVLADPALGCFVTHCGRNSTLESLASGVPVVAMPQWTDQGTNAKMASEMWRVGLRAEPRGDGLVEGRELRKCLELVMEREEFRENALRWKELAREAAREGGSSYRNLKAFVAELVGESCKGLNS